MPRPEFTGRAPSREEDILGPFLYNQYQKWIAEAKRLEQQEPKRYAGEEYRKAHGGKTYTQIMNQQYMDAIQRELKESKKPIQQPERPTLDKTLSLMVSDLLGVVRK